MAASFQFTQIGIVHSPFKKKGDIPVERNVMPGGFASLSPHRPNPLGMTIVRLRGRKKNILKVSGLDMVEGTPVLDIKPYLRKDRKKGMKTGWMK
jgi:tRNA (Thr-GGU) A37 N-methylase